MIYVINKKDPIRNGVYRAVQFYSKDIGKYPERLKIEHSADFNCWGRWLRKDVFEKLFEGDWILWNYLNPNKVFTISKESLEEKYQEITPGTVEGMFKNE